MQIRPATDADFDQIWSIFHAVVSAGDTYTYPRDTSKDQAYQYWMTAPQSTLVVEEDGHILGTYYIKPNQLGGGAHVLQLRLHGLAASTRTRTCQRHVRTLSSSHANMVSAPCNLISSWRAIQRRWHCGPSSALKP